jgi:uncharacterized protein YecE (DUF72 family)
MIRVGTSGYWYRDWLGPFYPEGLAQGEWLAHYASQFSTVELNVTYYRLPGQRTASGWAARTPADFTFAVKAFRGLTHERASPDFSAFADGLLPLKEAGKLGCVLAQFPRSFRPSPESWAYLEHMGQGLAGFPVVVEFRAGAWATRETLERLEELKMGYASVDQPKLPGLMPPLVAASGPVAYLRLHGRNAAAWHGQQRGWERYDYLYSAAELQELAERVRALAAKAPTVLVYFNNTPRAQAAENARALREMLGAAAL